MTGSAKYSEGQNSDKNIQYFLGINLNQTSVSEGLEKGGQRGFIE